MQHCYLAQTQTSMPRLALATSSDRCITFITHVVNKGATPMAPSHALLLLAICTKGGQHPTGRVRCA
jgi:hypothetical protein